VICHGITFYDAFKMQWQNTVSVTVLGDTVFCHMHSDVMSELLAVKFGILMPDKLPIPEKIKVVLVRNCS